MTAVVLFADLTSVVAVSTFGLLFSYVLANLSALKLKIENRTYPKGVSVVGLGSSLMLMVLILFVTPIAWITGVVLLALGAVVYFAGEKSTIDVNVLGHLESMPVGA